MTMVGADGREEREDREIERHDFAATTSNKQLNFVQHIMTILDTNGRAAVVCPTTSSSRAAPARRSAASCSPTSTCTRCCACRPASSTPRASRPTSCSSTRRSPVPDSRGPSDCGCTTCGRTSTSRSSRTRLRRPISTTSSRPTNRERRRQRVESERFRLLHLRRDGRPRQGQPRHHLARDESLEDLDNLPSPEILAREIVEDLSAALAEFEAVAAALEEQLDQPH
jgi:type I restriction enzyme M protein